MNTIKIDTQKRRNILYVSILSLFYLLALLLFSCYTSPIYPNYLGYDSAIFSLIGKGMTEGKLLYADLFDHKGPIIFLITALGHCLGGRSGILFLQCVFGIVSLNFCFFTGILLLPAKKFTSFGECLAIFFAVYSVFFFAFQRGNLTEEYSLPFISCSLYLFVRYALSDNEVPDHSPLYSLVHGINLACLIFLRLNNAATVGMGILVLAIYLLYHRRYANLVHNLVAGLIGLAIITIPMIIWFLKQGSVSDMLYATFLHNFKIAGNTGHISFGQDPVKLFALYLPIVICCYFSVATFMGTKKKQLVDILLMSILGINLVSLWVANRFPHYFTVFSPVYAAFLCRYLVSNKHRIVTMVVTFCTVLNLAFACYFSYVSLRDIYIAQTATHRSETICTDASRIPENERDSVIGYKISAWDYLSADIMPCYKYFTLQDTWAITNPQILEDYIEWLRLEKPLWVLVYPDEKILLF